MNSGPTISIGATGRDVRRLQRIFVMTKVLAPGNITGTFDSTTEQAVKDFQQGAGLTVDGIVGPITWQALPADPNTPLLARGASGSVVTALQKGLKKYSTPATDPGAVDGDFGPKTEAAVKAYQQDRAVHEDGIVGDRTWWVPAGAAGGGLLRGRVRFRARIADRRAAHLFRRRHNLRRYSPCGCSRAIEKQECPGHRRELHARPAGHAPHRPGIGRGQRSAPG